MSGEGADAERPGEDPAAGHVGSAATGGDDGASPGGPAQPGRIARARGTADQVERRARESFEQARARFIAVRLASEAFEHDRSRAGGLLAGGLAYRIFLWQIPLALFLVSAFGIAADLAGQDPADLARRSGMTAALSGAIAQGVNASSHGRVWYLFLGAGLTVWAGRGVFRGARLVSELAWGARAAPGSSLKGSLAITAFGLGVLAIQWLLPRVSTALGVPGFIHLVLGIVLATAALTFGLSLLPKAQAPWTAVIPGAVLLGVGLRLLGLAASTYFASRLDHANDLYGSLGIAIVMMLYLFLMARLFVGVQFLNATLYHRRAGLPDTLSVVFGEREQGGDHHPQADAAHDVVGQVGPDVHPSEPDRPDHAPQERSGPPG